MALRAAGAVRGSSRLRTPWLPSYRGGEPADSHKKGSIQRAAFNKSNKW